jgi:DNA-binding transcriptional regulator YiaG
VTFLFSKLRVVTSLGLAIRLHRTRAGLSQTALAKLLGGAGLRLVHLWEQDKVKPGSKYLSKINSFLAGDPAALKEE